MSAIHILIAWRDRRDTAPMGATIRDYTLANRLYEEATERIPYSDEWREEVYAEAIRLAQEREHARA